MRLFKIAWWTSLLITSYTYIGYGLLLFFVIRIKRILRKPLVYPDHSFVPTITILVAAYNEESFVEEKIKNTLQLLYPANKIKYLFVTDGSTDLTPIIVKRYPQVKLLHREERKGKIAAVDRAMKFVDTQVVIYTDANTFLNKEAVKKIVRHYQNPKVGGVAGEKRVYMKREDSAAGSGEGIYWKYESTLKKWDAELYSIVGAAGELFSIKTLLYETVPEDTVIEDFYMTLRIAQRGYRIAYEPDAYALETPSASVREELKRKTRIAAGGIQAILRLRSLLNIFRYGTLSFQYISHRVLRWTVTPFATITLLISNFFLARLKFFKITLLLQIAFYSAALIGFTLEKKAIRLKFFFIPYYFTFMNYSVIKGLFRYLRGKQSVIWERAERSLETSHKLK